MSSSPVSADHLSADPAACLIGWPAAHSRSPIIHKYWLKQFGIAALVHDPLGNADEAQAEYGIAITPLDELVELDVLILAVAHQAYLDAPAALLARVKDGGVVIDVKSVLDPAAMERGLRYWSL